MNECQKNDIIYYENECGICFNNFNQNDIIYKCKKCNNKFHKKCFKKWKKKIKNNQCIFCMTKNSMVEYNNKKLNPCLNYCNIL